MQPATVQEPSTNQRKRHAKKGSFDANGDKPIGNLLNDDDELQNATALQPG